MVLADLGRKLNAAFSQLNAAPIVDEKVCPGEYASTRTLIHDR